MQSSVISFRSCRLNFAERWNRTVTRCRYCARMDTRRFPITALGAAWLRLNFGSDAWIEEIAHDGTLLSPQARARS